MLNLLVAVVLGSSKTIYGVDDRLEYYEAPDHLQALTRNSVVALIAAPIADPKDEDGNHYAIWEEVALGPAYDVCDDSAYAEQPTAAFCSGTYLGDGLVLTAGHCITSHSGCCDTRFVFNYFYSGPNEPNVITDDDVYYCVDYYSTLTTSVTSLRDHAIIKLDRIPNRISSAVVSTYPGPVGATDLLSIIGFPNGVPAKILTDFIATDTRLDYFVGYPDTFTCNSGSGVFDSVGQIVGVHARGNTDFVSDGDCYRFAKELCTVNDCPGESMSYAFHAFDNVVRCSSDATCQGKSCVNGICWGDICANGSPPPTSGTSHDTDIRLVNPEQEGSIILGGVEIYHEGEWGTICDDWFTPNAADVICRQLGFVSTAYPYTYSSNFGTTPRLWLDDVICTGNEARIEDCTHRPWGETNCGHGEDIMVVCSTVADMFDPSQFTPVVPLQPKQVADGTLRLLSRQYEHDKVSGIVQIYHNSQWGDICGDFSIDSANVVCRQLGYESAIDYSGTVNGDAAWLNGVSCTGDEAAITDCQHLEWGEGYCSFFQHLRITCASDIRLVSAEAGAGYIVGAVEVYHSGQWGPVCDDGFTGSNKITITNTLCRQLGFERTVAPYFASTNIGKSNFQLDDLFCFGSETWIGDCDHAEWGDHNCMAREAVKVYCASDDVFTVTATPTPLPTATPPPCRNNASPSELNCDVIARMGACDSLFPDSEATVRHICPVSCNDCCTVDSTCACSNHAELQRIARSYGVGWIKTCKQALKYVSCDSYSNTIRELLAVNCPCDCPPPSQ
eukprot:c7671_g1_i1.p1 GENE.c7671_g1_i1~~c7671_g1_i1.p1  ORF type:complete len:786 (+),score=182.74 c7671_g1_i1:63-2420(+)